MQAQVLCLRVPTYSFWYLWYFRHLDVVPGVLQAKVQVPANYKGLPDFMSYSEATVAASQTESATNERQAVSTGSCRWVLQRSCSCRSSRLRLASHQIEVCLFNKSWDSRISKLLIHQAIPSQVREWNVTSKGWRSKQSQ